MAVSLVNHISCLELQRQTDLRATQRSKVFCRNLAFCLRSFASGTKKPRTRTADALLRRSRSSKRLKINCHSSSRIFLVMPHSLKVLSYCGFLIMMSKFHSRIVHTYVRLKPRLAMIWITSARGLSSCMYISKITSFCRLHSYLSSGFLFGILK
jgi:hypothetical protein